MTSNKVSLTIIGKNSNIQGDSSSTINEEQIQQQEQIQEQNQQQEFEEEKQQEQQQEQQQQQQNQQEIQEQNQQLEEQQQQLQLQEQIQQQEQQQQENFNNNNNGFINNLINENNMKEEFYDYQNQGINIIDFNNYSPMVYMMDQNKIIYSDNSYKYIYDIKKNNSLPYTYIAKNSTIKPNFDIKQSKLKLYNYWIITNSPKLIENKIINLFGIQNVYITKSLFFRKKNSYMGEKVILISKIPQKPYKFINRLNRTVSNDKRTVKSVLGDYIISPDCIFIIIAEKSIDYICNNYLRYHKEDSLKINSLINSMKKKFTCISDNDIENDLIN